MKDRNDNNTDNQIENKIDQIIIQMEKLSIAEYVEMLHNPRRLLLPNFISGVARGVGMAFGFTFLTALIIYLINALNILNLPVIGEFISDIVEIVKLNQKQ